MVAAGKKAAVTRATATYTFEEHLEGKPEGVKSLTLAVQEYIMNLDAAFEEAPKSFTSRTKFLKTLCALRCNVRSF